MKVLIYLSLLAITRAGVIETGYHPVYSSIHAPVVAKTAIPLTFTKTIPGPAPVYESVVTTHETKTNALGGTQYNTFSKSLDTPYASVRRFESSTARDGISAQHFFPTPQVHAVLNHPQTISTPLGTSPVNYQAPLSAVAHSYPVLAKTQQPVLGTPAAVKITYSDAPLVSHMTFTGLGTSYSW